MAETVLELDALHRQMDALQAQQARSLDMALSLGSANPSIPDSFEHFTAGFDDGRDDRAEISEMDQFHERLDAMQQAREQERTHTHGMEY
jgi:hypothetical protein